MKLLLAATLLLAPVLSHAGELLPTARGTSWTYDATEDEGSSAPASSKHAVVTRRFNGTRALHGQDLFELQTFTNGQLSLTELVVVHSQGVRTVATEKTDGAVNQLPQPAIVVPEKLASDATWTVEGEAGGVAMKQNWQILGTEDVAVPAGSYTAFHFRGEQTAPAAIVSDRWFMPGVGFVKEVTTMRGTDGHLLGRRILELRNPPHIAAAPAPSVDSKLTVGVSSKPIGSFESEISPQTPNLYARWEGSGLRDHAQIRAVWIAEDVGDIAAPNYQIDNATTVASSSDAHGLFTLNRPPDGWAPGKYRVEFYLDGTLVRAVPLRIRPAPVERPTPFDIHQEPN